MNIRFVAALLGAAVIMGSSYAALAEESKQEPIANKAVQQESDKQQSDAKAALSQTSAKPTESVNQSSPDKQVSAEQKKSDPTTNPAPAAGATK
jgi:hypothetical protein